MEMFPALHLPKQAKRFNHLFPKSMRILNGNYSVNTTSSSFHIYSIYVHVCALLKIPEFNPASSEKWFVVVAAPTAPPPPSKAKKEAKKLPPHCPNHHLAACFLPVVGNRISQHQLHMLLCLPGK
ncbi:hypothetical protein Nepgr_033384 [Nepenthes gracilis]|uniref:Uncharacterized protein n=1 Tax=Nepenthes gracilis TaxID=150966 RepID=A0AAD3TL42_NEPGR|nr:hypothetical protein Nepgr_033384 [Nepenthes gracilis]